MKLNRFIVPLILFFIQLSFCASAQKERIDDLVPFRGKTKWGLMHQSGKVFYQNVFDSIPDFERNAGVFSKNDFGDSVANVIINGVPKMLLRDKKLLTAEQYLALAIKKNKEPSVVQISNPVNSFKDGNISEKIDHAVEKRFNDDDGIWFKTSSGKIVNIKTSRNAGKNKIEFFIAGKHLEAFDCDNFSFAEADRKDGTYDYIIINKGLDAGCADLENEKISVPVENFTLEFCRQRPDWLIVNKKQLITTNNKMIGRSFLRIDDIYFSTAKQKAFFVVKDSSEQYRFYYPEADTLSAQSYGWLEEVFHGSDLYTSFKIPEPLFVAKKDRQYGIINLKNEAVSPFQSYHIEAPWTSRFAITATRTKQGFIDLGNKFFSVAPAFDKLERPRELNLKVNGVPYYIFSVKNDGQKYYVDNFGHEFLEK